MRVTLILIAISILAGCVVRNEIPVPTQSMAEISGYPLSKLKKGHEVYLSQCSRCHEPMMPSKVSSMDWHVVVPGMAWNAGISEDDEDAVLKYILSAR